MSEYAERSKVRSEFNKIVLDAWPTSKERTDLAFEAIPLGDGPMPYPGKADDTAKFHMRRRPIDFDDLFGDTTWED
jgi:hypothetical protein